MTPDMFRMCSLRHDSDLKSFEMMTSIYPLGTFGSVASLLAAKFITFCLYTNMLCHVK
jgi:hypothetical protein